MPGHSATLLGRYDVLDWGDGCVVYDRQQFLTHLLDEATAATLRDLTEAAEPSADTTAELTLFLTQVLPDGRPGPPTTP